MFSSCNSLEMPQFKSIDNIEISTIKDSITINSSIKLFNPNWHRLTVNNLEYFIMLDSILIGEGTTSDSFFIYGNDSLELETSFHLAKLPIEQMISLNDSSEIRLVCSTLLPIIKKRFYISF